MTNFSCCGGCMPLNTFAREEGLQKITQKAFELHNRDQRVVVIGIAGGSASGKSTLAKELRTLFSEAVVINVDDYYRSRCVHDYHFDQPEAVDLELFALHLRDLKSLKAVRKPIYSFKDNGGERIGCEKIQPTSFIIVDGLFTLNKIVADLCDIKVFVETDCHGRFVRRITRDVNRTGQDPVSILDYFLRFVEPSHRKYVDCQKFVADIIIKSPYDRLAEPEKAGCVKDCQIKMELLHPLTSEFLRKAGVEKLATTSQEDNYFTITCGHDDEVVRIRREPGDKLTFTYKSAPREDGKNKFEFPISFENKDIIEEMFTERAHVTKLRDIFCFNGIIFSQDEVKFGRGKKRYFLEIRGMKDIKDAEIFLKSLGLEGSFDLKKMSYLEMAS